MNLCFSVKGRIEGHSIFIRNTTSLKLLSTSFSAAAGVCVYGGLCVSSFQQQDISQ